MEKLTEGLKKLDLQFSENQIGQLESYINEVLEFNKTYNLMKADSADEMAVCHILDSLAAVPYLQKIINEICEKNGVSSINVGDIGSGGGCPGIPLAIAFPGQNFTLVERMDKRCIFLESVVAKLKLENVKVFCTNADFVKPESFDLEVFRAFHPFDKKIINMLFKMLKKGGFIAAYKAREEKILAEMAEINQIVSNYEKIKMTVPFMEDHERNLVVIKK